MQEVTDGDGDAGTAGDTDGDADSDGDAGIVHQILHCTWHVLNIIIAI